VGDDTDGDGVRDLLGLAGLDSSQGVEAGRVYAVDGAGSDALEPLDLPGVASGHEIGRGMGLQDVDGDGALDLLVGVPGAGVLDRGANAGMVVSFPGDGAGFGAQGSEVFGGHATHGASDHFGYALASAGDFDGDGWEDLAVVSRKGSRPSSFSDDVLNPEDCPGTRTESGEVLVHLGGPGGLAAEPSFAWYGPDPAGFVYRARGGFDRGGDGYDDLVVGSEAWGDGGGFAFVYGRPAGDGLTILCGDERYATGSRFDDLGASLAALGDLDGDGCDEVAVGAPRAEADDFNQGVVRVLWGAGDACAGGPTLTAMAVDVVGAGAGTALASGGDVDGDGIPDLAVGAATWRADFAEVGAVLLVRGSHLLTLPRQPHEPGAFPDDEVVVRMLPGEGVEPRSGLLGTHAGGGFGEAVALVPDPTAPGRHALAVGLPQGEEGGTGRGGGVVIHRWVEDAGDEGLEPLPWIVFAGESSSPGGRLGAALEAGRGDLADLLLVGAPDSNAAGLDQGAVYVLRLD
jgi:hypothetical protein